MGRAIGSDEGDDGAMVECNAVVEQSSDDADERKGLQQRTEENERVKQGIKREASILLRLFIMVSNQEGQESGGAVASGQLLVASFLAMHCSFVIFAVMSFSRVLETCLDFKRL